MSYNLAARKHRYWLRRPRDADDMVASLRPGLKETYCIRHDVTSAYIAIINDRPEARNLKAGEPHFHLETQQFDGYEDARDYELVSVLTMQTNNGNYLSVDPDDTSVITQPMDDIDWHRIDTDADPRFFYTSQSRGYFFFESTLHKGHYLAVDQGRVIVKKTDQPEQDVTLRFTLIPTDCCHD